MTNSVSVQQKSPVARIYHYLTTGTRFISFLLAVVITLVVFAGVVSRYIAHSSFTWTDELAGWLFFWMICAGLANGHITDSHISIDLYSSKLSERGKKIRLFVIDCIVFSATLLMFTASYRYAKVIGGNSISLGIPNAVKIIPLPICCAVSLIIIFLKDAADRKRLLIHTIAIAVALLFLVLTGFGTNMPSLGIRPSIVMMLIFFASILIGAPISFSMILATFTATASADLLPGVAVVQNMVAGGGKFVLLAIPFFLIAGYLMNLGGLSSRILDFASSLVSHFTGGLGKVNILNSLLMGGISGSSGADAASTTKVLVPEMEKRGYDRAFACAVTASSAVLPNVIPPAITMLVVASVADVSILSLFMGGMGPGILLALLQMFVVQIVSKKRGYEVAGVKASGKVRWECFVKAIPSMLLFVWIIGSIRLGIVTASEAGVVGMIWALILGIIYKAIKPKQLYEEIINSSVDAGLIGLLIAASNPFAWVLIADHLPQTLVAIASSMNLTQTTLLLIVTLCMIVLGTFIDVSVSILIAVPLFLPLAKLLGVDIVLFSIVLILGAVIGNITPPVGILVYITSSIADVQPTKVFKECIPFILSIAVGILLIIFCPVICTGLVSLVCGA
jgi:TRAP transporter, DctM subunit